MCMTDDGEQWTLFRSGQRRAAKDHRCCECGRTIASGEHYAYATGLIDDTWLSYRTCVQCEAACGWLRIVCGGWVYGLTEEDLVNHVTGDERDLRSRPLTRLVRWMKADWRTRSGDLRSVEDVRSVVTDAVDAYRVQFETAVGRQPRMSS
jgi:hypothetical protein